MKFRILRRSEAPRRRVSGLLCAWTLFAGGARAADSGANWPQFRGPGSLGVATGTNLPEHWSTNENVAWKVDVGELKRERDEVVCGPRNLTPEEIKLVESEAR